MVIETFAGVPNAGHEHWALFCHGLFTHGSFSRALVSRAMRPHSNSLFGGFRVRHRGPEQR